MKAAAKPTVLVVDDKPNMLALLTKLLGKSARVVTARGVRQAIETLEKELVRTVLCDLRLGDGTGLDVLRAVRARWSRVPFLLMTAYASVPTAVQAMREGAFEYVTKPFDSNELRALVERALAHARVLGPSTGEEEEDAGPLFGRSAAMRDVAQMIERVATTDTTVLLVGESGTGKETVARAIHERSSRSARRAQVVACDAIQRSAIESELFGHAKGAFVGAVADRPGLIEEADGSTIIVDEVSVLRPTIQARLARAMEDRTVRRIGDARDRRVDVRFIATSTRDLRTLVDRGDFREDLFFRLNVCVLELPPLRQRLDDVPVLARRFLADCSPRAKRALSGFTDDAIAALQSYRWPGNVRELQSVVERAALLETSDVIRRDSLPEEILGVAPLRLTTSSDIDLARLTYREAVDVSHEETNRRYLEAVLRRFQGDVVAAAQHAGIERESMYRLLRRCGLAPEDYRGSRRPDASSN